MFLIIICLHLLCCTTFHQLHSVIIFHVHNTSRCNLDLWIVMSLPDITYNLFFTFIIYLFLFYLFIFFIIFILLLLVYLNKDILLDLYIIVNKFNFLFLFLWPWPLTYISQGLECLDLTWIFSQDYTMTSALYGAVVWPWSLKNSH